MEAELFVKKLSETSPSVDEFKSIGITGENVSKFTDKYIANSKGINQNLYEDELLRLVNNYDLNSIEIGMLSFSNSVEEDEGLYYIGKAERDELVINKTTHEVQIHEFDSPEHLLWSCASNGAMFLDALVLAVPFLTKCMFDDSLWNNRKVILAISNECADAAGGKKYLGFYKVLLGYYE